MTGFRRSLAGRRPPANDPGAPAGLDWVSVHHHTAPQLRPGPRLVCPLPTAAALDAAFRSALIGQCLRLGIIVT